MPDTNVTRTNFSTSSPAWTDIQIAGWTLVIPGIASLTLYMICMKAMWQLKNQFRLLLFLISFGICDIGIILLCLYYGISILLQYSIIDGWVILIVSEFLWHPIIYHYSLLAASRFAGIVWPHFTNVFLNQQRIFAICLAVWAIGMLQFGVILLYKIDPVFQNFF